MNRRNFLQRGAMAIAAVVVGRHVAPAAALPVAVDDFTDDPPTEAAIEEMLDWEQPNLPPHHFNCRTMGLNFYDLNRATLLMYPGLVSGKRFSHDA